jgi:hypothetical protein
VKLLTGDEMISLASVDEKDIADSQQKMLPVTGEITEWDWLWNGVKAGFYKAVEVRRAGQAQYRYFYHLNDQHFLNVNASVFVGTKPDKWLWILGADLIAASERARGIICTTNRRGQIEACERIGYKILGVRLFKEIDL